jgi:hypothetical protein
MHGDDPWVDSETVEKIVECTVCTYSRRFIEFLDGEVNGDYLTG